MHEVTQILSQIKSGDPSVADQLLPLVYDELRRLATAKLAQERPGMTLQATALVHEVYIRLVDQEQVQCWESSGRFFAAAAEAMRRILVESARSKQRLKRGGDWNRLDLDSIEVQLPGTNIDILALDEALSQLAKEHPDKAELVRLRFFTGLTIDESAQAMGISTATAGRSWRYARAWLAEKLDEADREKSDHQLS